MKVVSFLFALMLCVTPAFAGFVDEVGGIDGTKDTVNLISPRQGVMYAFEFDGHNIQALTTVSLYDFVLDGTRWASFDLGAAPQEVGFAGASLNTKPILMLVPYVGERLVALVDVIPGDFVGMDIGVGYAHSWQTQENSWVGYLPVFQYEF